jgi:hypothetical protein
VNLENYEPVSVRLDRWLKATHETGRQPRVITDLVHYLADTAVFKAELWIDDVLVSTGWAEEIRGSSPVNRTSHLENAESSAVGRALGNYGLAGTDPAKRPSREEMGKVQRMGGDAQPSSAGQRTLSGGITPAQAGKIKAMCKSMGKLPPVGLDDMTKQDASSLIESLIQESQAGAVRDAFPDSQEDPF